MKIVKWLLHPHIVVDRNVQDRLHISSKMLPLALIEGGQLRQSSHPIRMGGALLCYNIQFSHNIKITDMGSE